MAPMPSFAVHAADAVLEPDPLDPNAIRGGAPRTSNLVLSESDDGRIVRGLWECTEGVFSDEEADELFVVLTGRATIRFQDGRVLELGPGDVGVLERGARTTWTVHETLRKAYQITVHP
jgi:uncharacterized cupin superfamily protein